MEATTTEATASTATTPKGKRAPRQAKPSDLDRELYCPNAEWLLMSSAAAMGQRGTLASVTASIERGGVGGGTEDPNLGMLRRLGWKDTGHWRPQGQVVDRARTLQARLVMLPALQQERMWAHYVLTARAPDTLRARFGRLAGLVLFRWLRRREADRGRDVGAQVTKLIATLEPLRQAIPPLELELAMLRALPTYPAPLADHAPRPVRQPLPAFTGDEAEDVLLLRAWRAAYLAEVRPWNARQAALRDAAIDAHQARLSAAQARLPALLAELRPLQAESARICAEASTLASANSIEDDIRDLVETCKSSERAELVDGADRDARVAHKAWFATAKKAAKVWLENGEPTA